MRAFGAGAPIEATVHLTGGATAVLIGWRASTIDIDIRIEPDDDRLLRSLPELKEELQVNVELASPADFIPTVPGWGERSLFVARHGHVSYYHYDFYAQALSKVERIEPALYRYPAIDPPSFRAKVRAAFDSSEE